MIRKSPSELTEVGKREAVIDGKTISYIIRSSPRAKYVRLEVRPETGLTIVIPKSYKPGRIPDLLKKKERWISDKLAKYGHAEQPESSRELKNGDTVPWLGGDLKLDIRPSSRNIESVKLEKNRLVVHLAVGGISLELLLERWYRLQAAQLIEEKAKKLSALMGLGYNRLYIRGQKTRWGSCSRKANLSFNWKLMMVPEPVIHYVVIHELAHLQEMNHSKKFWQLVEQYCPKWRNQRKWLKDHTAELTASLPL